MTVGRWGVALGIMLAATPLSAHDLFLKLDSHFVEPESRPTVALFNGTFGVSENSITEDRVRSLLISGPSGVEEVARDAWDASGTTTFFPVRFGRAGTYALGVSTAPRLIELDGQSFNEYLEHDGVPGVLEARRRAGDLDKPVVERYSKHVKAVVQVGEDHTTGWEEPMDFPAEIVPLVNPFRLSTGDQLRARIIVDGIPVPNQMVIAGRDGGGGAFEEKQVRSDADGIALFELDRPGRWYLKFIHMVETENEGVDYESKWATLTFQVR
jgi:hypothetical protein